MTENDAENFHKLYGVRKTRIFYQNKDFFDYTLMIFICALVVHFSYGFDHLVSIIGKFICAFMVVVFMVRHGVTFRVPIIIKRPQDIVYMILYKIQNMKFIYLIAVFIFLLENFIIYLTPDLPHYTELTRKIAIYLIYIHLIILSIYRTVSLVDHLRKKELVREILMQTSWKGFIIKQPNIILEIVHAYLTGILTHIILIAPWYLLITYFNISILLLPVVCLINVATHLKYFKVYNAWFYRDHWLGHHSEFEFLYLHGTHHDAIPSGLIGVSGNGYLEGFLRHTLGHPTPFYNPLIAFLLYTIEVQQDINNHQYIPGIFPRLPRCFHEICQHSTHHFGRLEPYGVALKNDDVENEKTGGSIFPDEVVNSIKLDEQLTGFQWNNPRYKHFLKLFDKYQK